MLCESVNAVMSGLIGYAQAKRKQQKCVMAEKGFILLFLKWRVKNCFFFSFFYLRDSSSAFSRTICQFDFCVSLGLVSLFYFSNFITYFCFYAWPWNLGTRYSSGKLFCFPLIELRLQFNSFHG